MLKIKDENGRYQLQSGDNWQPLPVNLKNIADVKKFFNTEDIELINGRTNLPYITYNVLSYDGMNLKLQDESGEKLIYIPDRDEREITEYLMNEGKAQGYSQVIIKFQKPIKEKKPDSQN